MSLVKQAIEAKLRPTTLILHSQPDEPWSEHDFNLLEAIGTLEAERCHQCGLPRYICHNDDADLDFRVLEDDCRAIVAKDAYEEGERAAGGENYKPPVGTTLRPEPYLISGGDPATLRNSYYENEYLKQQAIENPES